MLGLKEAMSAILKAEGANTEMEEVGDFENAYWGEKAARIEKLRQSKPVQITGEEYRGKYELNRDSAKVWIKDNLRGEYTIADTGETVSLTKVGANKVTSHSMGSESHLKSIAAIPQLINHAVFIEELPNTKDNEKYDSYRYYVCGFKIGDTDYTVKLTIGVKQGKKYYDHSLTEIEKGKLLDLIKDQAVESGFTTTGDAPSQSYAISIDKDKRLLSISQTNSSKVVDENGEPREIDGVFVRSDRNFMEDFNKVINDAQRYANRIRKAENDTGTKFGTMEFLYTKEGEDVSDSLMREEYYFGNLVEELLKGKTPQVKIAFRYGEIPESQLSRNWADNHWEKVVSVVGRVAELNTNRNFIYDAIYRGEGEPPTPYNVVAGVSFGNIGSDGEMLLSPAIVIGNAESISNIAKSATDNNGDFSQDNNDIRFRGTNDDTHRPSFTETARREVEELASLLHPDNVEVITDTELLESKPQSEDNKILPRDGDKAEEVNARFNEELQQQIDGTLPKGHIYDMGMPGEILLSTGIANVPIQLNSTRLAAKSSQFGHDYDLSEIKDLVKAINKPVAVFAYGDKEKAQNIIVEIQHEGKNFVVGFSIRPTVDGRVLEVNSIRNIFPKKNAEWLNWISQGKLLYVDKEKIQALIDQQRTILADVENSDLNTQTLIDQQRSTLAEVYYLDLEDIAKVVENPKLSDENLQREGAEQQPRKEHSLTAKEHRQREAYSERQWRRAHDVARETIEKLKITDDVTVYDSINEVAGVEKMSDKQRRNKGWYNKKNSKIVIVLGNHHSPQDVMQTILHEAVAHYGLRKLLGNKFDGFLDNVFEQADDTIREEIKRLRKKYYNAYVKNAVKDVSDPMAQAERITSLPKTEADFTALATEEYLASLAEELPLNRSK